MILFPIKFQNIKISSLDIILFLVTDTDPMSKRRTPASSIRSVGRNNLRRQPLMNRLSLQSVVCVFYFCWPPLPVGRLPYIKRAAYHNECPKQVFRIIIIIIFLLYLNWYYLSVRVHIKPSIHGMSSLKILCSNFLHRMFVHIASKILSDPFL